MIEESVKRMTKRIVKPEVEWDNVYTPYAGVSDLDRERHFTNLDQDLLRKVRQVKAQ